MCRLPWLFLVVVVVNLKPITSVGETSGSTKPKVQWADDLPEKKPLVKVINPETSPPASPPSTPTVAKNNKETSTPTIKSVWTPDTCKLDCQKKHGFAVFSADGKLPAVTMSVSIGVMQSNVCNCIPAGALLHRLTLAGEDVKEFKTEFQKSPKDAQAWFIKKSITVEYPNQSPTAPAPKLAKLKGGRLNPQGTL